MKHMNLLSALILLFLTQQAFCFERFQNLQFAIIKRAAAELAYKTMGTQLKQALELAYRVPQAQVEYNKAKEDLDKAIALEKKCYEKVREKEREQERECDQELVKIRASLGKIFSLGQSIPHTLRDLEREYNAGRWYHW